MSIDHAPTAQLRTCSRRRRNCPPAGSTPTTPHALEAHAESGGSVLLVPEPGDEHRRSARRGTVGTPLPHTEWFITLADRPEAVRLDGEVPVTTPLLTLDPFDPDVEVAATTSVQFAHQPTMLVRRVGAGRVVTVGMTAAGAVDAHPTLGPYLRRLLRHDFPSSPVDDLGVAVVGYGPFGGMGYLHGLAATETDGLALVAAADNSSDRLDAARVDFPDLRGHASGDLTRRRRPTSTSPSSPPRRSTTPSSHVELLRAGKHVVVEKPMCLDHGRRRRPDPHRQPRSAGPSPSTRAAGGTPTGWRSDG